MIPGPRPSTGQTRPAGGRDRGPEDVRPLRPVPPAEAGGVRAVLGADPVGADAPVADVPAPVALTRSPRGWAVVSPAGTEPVADLLEGMSLADLVAEEFGALPEPDRSSRRSARGTAGDAAEGLDPVDARIAALERTVAQLEHALAARVSTERAIGVLAERHGTDPRAAFESLRRDARSQGRPVAELAREVLDSLTVPPGHAPVQEVPPAAPDPRTPSPGESAVELPVAAADGRS